MNPERKARSGVAPSHETRAAGRGRCYQSDLAAVFVPFSPAADASSCPAVFPSPFREGPPHPLARRAAEEMQAWLPTHPELDPSMFHGARGGKMFGVLVVRERGGQLGYLRGFAGMLGETRLVEGFVPPIFDIAAYARLWETEGGEVDSLERQRRGLLAQPDRSEAVEAELRRLSARQRECSAALLPKLQATYRVRSATGAVASLASLFDPRPPPGGAGDCAAPRLLGAAFEIGAIPIALAEFWWGDAATAGGRHHGRYYPACRGRCATVLPFMLDGIACEPPPLFLDSTIRGDPQILFEDDWLVVVDKPSGLLSVPGRGAARRECLQLHLQQRAELQDASWPRLVHRLDQPTSGLLIAAKDKPTYVAMQRQFSERTIDKRYEALLQGSVQGDEGTIDLALRADYDDRPRQIHDPIDGKRAQTDWRVIARGETTTRVTFAPRTGRCHQLRLHAAHPLGLDAPIVGDGLYGFGGERLHLHAKSLRFRHPVTAETIDLHSPCPF